jgi:hypothetical protein
MSDEEELPGAPLLPKNAKIEKPKPLRRRGME